MDFIPVQTSEDREAYYGLRYRIFCEEKGVPVELERDADDQIALHILVRDKGEPVAVARMAPRKEFGAKIGRVAVVENHRHRGIGKMLVRKLENQARRQGQRQVVLDAPLDVLEFYHQLGYRAFGEVFRDAGILHRSMRKRLGDLLVVAVGGNAMEEGYKSALYTAEFLVDLLQAGYRLVLTHGNGPQVGKALLRSELAREQVATQSLDTCVASTQGTMGYYFQRALTEILEGRGMAQRPVTVITRTVVDAQDPAFQNPTKPIGPFMTKDEALQRAQNEGWEVREDSGRGWRRVVPSPEPHHMVEMEAFKALLEQDFLVIAAGGGGIPMTTDHHGLSAVIDKDKTAALLAYELEADGFVIATAVEKVAIHFGTPEQEDLDDLTPEKAQELADEGHFAPGSMLPKVTAALRFVNNTKRWAAITTAEKMMDAVEGKGGTRIEHAELRTGPFAHAGSEN